MAHFYRLAFLALCFASFVTAKEFMFFFYMSVFWLVGWLVGELVPEENNCIVGALLLFLVWQLVLQSILKNEDAS